MVFDPLYQRLGRQVLLQCWDRRLETRLLGLERALQHPPHQTHPPAVYRERVLGAREAQASR